jgi:AhpD family alkylhydroperoxidase
MKSGLGRTTAVLALCLLGAGGSSAAAEEANAGAKAALADIEKTFGFVPGFLRAFPEEGIAGAWDEFKSVQLNPATQLPGKYKELMGLAIAAQIPCDYCTYFHTRAAKANGASEREIKEAVAMGSIVRHWSTYLNGAQIDEAQFKKELQQVVENAKAGANKPAPTAIAIKDAASAREDIRATFGFVPGFMKSFPDAGIAGAWKEMKSIQLNPATAIPGKYKELIGLAVAAQIPCRYCIAFHTTASMELLGATQTEVGETLALAGIVRHWSTFLNGMRIDPATFRKEVDRVMAGAPKKTAQRDIALDGKTFVGTIVPKGKSSGDPDTIVFMDGKFRSEACERYGFEAVPYSAKAESGKVKFELDAENSGGAKNHWSGTVQGNKLVASMRSMAGGKTTDYVVKAELKE